MSKERIQDHFASGDAFEEALASADDNVRTDREAEFLADLSESWDKYGMRAALSQAQYDWLMRLADR